jgi:hypothetical protein
MQGQLTTKAALYAATACYMPNLHHFVDRFVTWQRPLLLLLLVLLQGYYRRGDAYFMLGKFKDAIKDLKTVSTLISRRAWHCSAVAAQQLHNSCKCSHIWCSERLCRPLCSNCPAAEDSSTFVDAYSDVQCGGETQHDEAVQLDTA